MITVAEVYPDNSVQAAETADVLLVHGNHFSHILGIVGIRSDSASYIIGPCGLLFEVTSI